MKRVVARVILSAAIAVCVVFGICACGSEKDALDPAQVSIQEINTTLGEMKAVDEALDSSISALTGRVDVLEGELDTLDATVGGINSALTQEIADRKAEIKVLQDKDSELQGKISSLEQALSDKEQGIKDFTSGAFLTLSDWTAFKAEINTAIAGLTSKIEWLEASIGKINTTLEEMRETDGELQGNINGLTTRVTTLETELIGVNVKITSLQTDSATKAELENIKKSLEAQIEKIKSDIATMQEKDSELQGKITALGGSLTSEITNVKAWATDTFLSIENWNTEKATIEGDIKNLSDRVDAIDNTLIAVDISINALATQVEQNRKDIEDLTIRVNCLEGKHEYDRTQIAYIWSEDWQVCEFSIPCKHCDATWGNSTANLSYDNFKLSAIFDQKDNVEPAVLDISDAREFTVDEITMAVSRMISNGEADNVVVKLTLADDAGSDVFKAIVEGMANAWDGTVNLTLGGVTAIPEKAFNNCKKLKSISIPEGTTEIGKSAFIKCSGLKSITLPSSLTTIGEGVLWECGSLEDITIPEKITSIPKSTFYMCKSLASVTLNGVIESIDSNAFSDVSTENITLTLAKGQKILVLDNDTKKYGESDELLYGGTKFCEMTFKKILSTFEIDATEMDNPTIKEAIENFIGKGARNIIITLPDAPKASMFGFIKAGIANAENGSVRLTLKGNLASIPEQAFIESKAIGEIILPESVTNIGKQAFQCCTFLTSVTFEEGSKLETIGESAFDECTALTDITIPKSVTLIDNRAFFNCSALKSVTFEVGSKLEAIGEHAFHITVLTSITIPASVTNIGDYAFAENRSLTTVIFETGSKLETIGEHAFFNCTALTSISIPEGTVSIGNNIFQNCSNLTTVTLPSTLTTIGSSAFWSCTALESITIPEKVTSITETVFYECTSLTSMTFEGVIGIDASAFAGVNSNNVTLTLAKGQNNFVWSSDDNDFIGSEDEVEAGDNKTFCGKTFAQIIIAE